MKKTIAGIVLATVAFAAVAGVSQKARISVVQDVDGYNSWPMIQVVDGRLVCAYGRGKGHFVEGSRGAYVRTSSDGGRTWSPEVCIANDPVICEGVEGAGLDSSGAALFWMNCRGMGHIWHELYRTEDGVIFTKIAAPGIALAAVQVPERAQDAFLAAELHHGRQEQERVRQDDRRAANPRRNRGIPQVHAQSGKNRGTVRQGVASKTLIGGQKFRVLCTIRGCTRAHLRNSPDPSHSNHAARR